MAYKNVCGFNYICTSIKNPDTNVAFSKNASQSFYILHYLLNHNNVSYKKLFTKTVIEDYARLINKLGYSTNDPKINRTNKKRKTNRDSEVQDIEMGLHSGLINDADWKTYFMNKGHKGSEIKLERNLEIFLNSLTKYLITKKNSKKSINFEHFNNIKANLKQLIESNLFVSKTGKPEKEQEKEIFDAFFVIIFDEDKKLLEQAITVQPQLELLSKNDPYAALTWIMLFSLYPNIGEADKLADVLELFGKEYTDTDIIKPSIIDIDSHSYDALKFSMAEKFKCGADEIENNRINLFDKNQKGSIILKNSFERYEYIHLMLLYVHAKIKEHMNDQSELSALSDLIDYAIEIIKELESDLDYEFYCIELIQFKIEKVDVLWRLRIYDKMHQQLTDLDSVLSSRYDIADRHRELLAIIKRKEGIYFNHIMDFENAVRVLASSFFLFDESMKLQRSIVKNNEAYMYRKWMKLDNSKQSYESAFELKSDREKYDPESVAVLRSNMARTYILCHEFNHAKALINSSYNYRQTAYNKKPETYRWKYCYSTITYAELYTVMGIFESNPNAQRKYFKKASEMLHTAKQLLGDDIKKGESPRIHYWQINAIFSYYNNNNNEAEACLEKLNNYHSIDTNLVKPKLIPLSIYRGKLRLKDRKYREAFDSFMNAYESAKELCKTHPSYHLYSMMVSEFHLGALLYLHDGIINERQKETATELIISSKKHIEELMIDSDNIAKEYSGTNSKAFNIEKEQIDTFLEYIEGNKKDKGALNEILVNFFVAIQ